MEGPLAKRAIDIWVSLVGLILAAPLLIIVSALVVLDVGRPVLFRQRRPGRNGEIFTLVKFRTMRSGPGDDAQRLTKIGRLLRATSLDELPELWNVLRGDMSLVGPRPLLPDYLPLYTEHQQRRHEVRPGITGLAQVRGRNLLSWEERFDLDVWYVDHQSLALDVRIMFETVRTVIAAEGVAATDHVTMEPFQGSTPAETAATNTAGDPT